MYEEEQAAEETAPAAAATEEAAPADAAGVASGATFAGSHSTSFSDLLLKEEVLRAIQDNGFENPSAVQNETLPFTLQGRDVLCQAKSGMGKTAVFVLTVLNALKPRPNTVQCVCVAPTRELAFQIAKDFRRFSVHIPNMKVLSVFGQTSIKDQAEMLASGNISIVVGCMGRINHLYEEAKLDLSQVRFFVVDECDKVLANEDDMPKLQAIASAMPSKKQTMFFSATMPEEEKEKARKFLTNPCEIFLDASKLVLHGLVQRYIALEEKAKIRRLMELLETLHYNQVVIFVNKVQRCRALADVLKQKGNPVSSMHARLRQEERIKRYSDFKQGETRIMVSTDLFERGVDFQRTNIVINFDVPSKSDTYLHRVGRAGRFGTNGLAITFVSTEEDKALLKEIQERFVVEIPEVQDVSTIDRSTYMQG